MKSIIIPTLAISIAFTVITGCDTKKGDADSGGDNPALAQSASPEASSTVDPDCRWCQDEDTLWGPMKAPRPYLDKVRTERPGYYNGLNGENDERRDDTLANYAFISCEGLRKGWTVKQVLDDDGAPDPSLVPDLTFVVKTAAQYVCPDQNSRING